MNLLYKILKFFVFANFLIFPIAAYANEITYQNLLKRNISTKIMNVEKIIKEKGLDSFVTLSVAVDEEIIYCHYEKENKKNRSKFKLVMCY